MDRKLIRIVLLLLAIYLFLLSIKLMGSGFKALGTEFAKSVIATTSNPIVGLFIGILVTTVVQSSSCTTSLVVALVGSGAMTIANAIPIIMGANMGTTVTNTIVSFGHITRRTEFQKAFGGAVVHDIFNLLSVLVLLPLEMVLHPIQTISTMLADAFYGIGGFTFTSPLHVIIDPAKHYVIAILESIFGNNPVAIIVFALALLFLSLKIIVDSMRSVVLSEIETLIDSFLFRNGWTGFFTGLFFTAVVQSSSVTTSIVIPLIGAGLLSIEKVFPYVLGANVGTTITAILAALAISGPTAKAAITTAFAHLTFNLLGIALWYPLRRVPIALAKRLSGIILISRKYAIAYVLTVFYLIPIALVFILR
ncbi:MAG: Na/Pi symporter [Candidatus Diapherotrites archaeon]|nr:Na/Pi symporter [Candidatus Diapherotrites archaeon]